MDHNDALRPDRWWESGLGTVRENWTWVLASGMAFVVFGFIALGYSVLVTLASVVVLGWLLVFGGMFEIVHAFKTPRWGGFFIEALAGILYVVVGLLLAFNPGAGALSLTLLTAAFFLVAGVFRAVAAVTLRPSTWGWLLLSGVVTFILGVLIWSGWPVSALWVIGFFIGIDMLFSGTWMIALALAARRAPAWREDDRAASTAAHARESMRQTG